MQARRADEPGSREGPTRVLAVVGGIASGKSSAARLLAGEDGVVLSADEVARAVLDTDELGRLVRERFGEGLVDERGRPDRAALAALVFDPERGADARRALEGWTHPRVRARILERLRDARSSGVPRVVLDVPLLLENDAEHGWTDRCDALVFVDVDPGERERRARLSRGWSPGEVARREAAQLPLAEKRERADYVLSNNGSPEELARAVSRILEQLDAS